jgi:hypothetical protein
MTARLDHLVVAATDLASGTAWLEARLGVALAPGGAHPRMGTHNRVLRLGEGVYLELIAIDPEAPPPGRPRWFGLDAPELAARLAERPRLVAWAAATDDLGSAVAASPVPIGTVHEMTRGDLVWRIAIPDDGAPVEGGAVPTLIEWPAGVHPTARMPEAGCSLKRLSLHHPDPARLATIFAAIGLADRAVRVAGGPASLAADLNTPGGAVRLD